MSIYKSRDIRGSDGELSPDLYRAWGRALGSQLPAAAKFVVGGDVRASTPTLLAALVEGLCQSGADVVELGILPKAMIHYAKRRLAADGCAIVTASHAPADWNGLCWLLGDQPPTEHDVARLRHAAENGFHPPGDRRRVAPRALDISFDYVAWLQETFTDAMATPCQAVLDPMHGTWAGRVRRYVNAIFPQGLFTAIRDDARADFGGLTPDCSCASNLDALGEAVYRQRAMLGIAFGGDGDCLALVDGDGVPLSGEETAWVLLQTFEEPWNGQPFVHDARLSDRIREAGAALGAEPVAERCDCSAIAQRVRACSARFGAELGGHYFYCDVDGSDALLSACRVIAHLGRTGRTLAELRRHCPAVYATPELRLEMPTQRQQQLLEQIRTGWEGHPCRELDGVRIDTPGGWFLARPTADETALALRFEAADWDALDALVREFCRRMPEAGEQLLAEYRSALGLPMAGV